MSRGGVYKFYGLGMKLSLSLVVRARMLRYRRPDGSRQVDGNVISFAGFKANVFPVAYRYARVKRKKWTRRRNDRFTVLGSRGAARRFSFRSDQHKGLTWEWMGASCFLRLGAALTPRFGVAYASGLGLQQHSTGQAHVFNSSSGLAAPSALLLSCSFLHWVLLIVVGNKLEGSGATLIFRSIICDVTTPGNPSCSIIPLCG
ncbi:unnamed protein product [Pleuronectes platessa]|uniref:Uncharacterized protein n=1 Tax=Pleuronectes platessa TaxID=8262 RepID=A0A9N7TI77_PLEPL|nr:unnamed protein product [Pleuronectes platessa]